jgi:DNA-binding beta-propeller fold protein YncE
MDNLYVTNAISNNISKFNSSGGHLMDFTPVLTSPLGIAIDSSGNIYAANGGNRTISKFDSSGNFLTTWSTGTNAPSFLSFKPITVPEPSTHALSAIATVVITYLAKRHKTRTS